jgi:hypothetical protein
LQATGDTSVNIFESGNDGEVGKLDRNLLVMPMISVVECHGYDHGYCIVVVFLDSHVNHLRNNNVENKFCNGVIQK